MFEYLKKLNKKKKINFDYIEKILEMDSIKNLKMSSNEKVYAILLRQSDIVKNSFEPIIAYEFGSGDENRIFNETFIPENVPSINNMFETNAIVIIHNHPKVNDKIIKAYPSKDDILSTIQVGEYWQSEGCFLLDHIIVNEKDHYSFVENNLINIF